MVPPLHPCRSQFRACIVNGKMGHKCIHCSKFLTSNASGLNKHLQSCSKYRDKVKAGLEQEVLESGSISQPTTSSQTAVVQIITQSGEIVTQSSKVMTFCDRTGSDASKSCIYFVTSNANKLREVRYILGDDFPFHIESVSLELDEIQDEDPDMIAMRKCKEAAKLLNRPLITEDTCLSFNALDGLPGPYIKWFLQKLGKDGLVKMLSAFEDKTASAIASVSYWDGQEVVMFKGVVQGTIVHPHGPEHSFGWDPIFLPDGSDLTFAEMGPEEKNKISHRTKAMNLFKEYIMRTPLKAN